MQILGPDVGNVGKVGFLIISVTDSGLCNPIYLIDIIGVCREINASLIYLIQQHTQIPNSRPDPDPQNIRCRSGDVVIMGMSPK